MTNGAELAVSPRMANAVDRLIGARIAARRTEIGMEQQTLADALHLTVEQLHKMERGTARVAASLLLRMSQLLDTPVSALLPLSSGESAIDVAALSDPLTGEMLRTWARLNTQSRKALLTVAAAFEAHFAPPKTKRM